MRPEDERKKKKSKKFLHRFSGNAHDFGLKNFTKLVYAGTTESSEGMTSIKYKLYDIYHKQLVH